MQNVKIVILCFFYVNRALPPSPHINKFKLKKHCWIVIRSLTSMYWTSSYALSGIELWRSWKRNVKTRNVLTILLCNDLDVDLWPWPWYGTRTYFYHKVKVRGQDLDHYPAKLLKHYRFVQNVFTFFLIHYFLAKRDPCQNWNHV